MQATRAQPAAFPAAPAWLRLSVADMLCLALLAWLLLFTLSGSGLGLLQDSVTGFQIRVGDSILENGSVPRTDRFSFSQPGQPFNSHEWLTAVVLSVVYGSMGFKGIILLGAALILASFFLVLRRMALLGANVIFALAVMQFSIGASSVHFVTRPHLVTPVLLGIALLIIHSGRRLWLLIPLMVLWVNLHGGFLALPITLTALAAGSALETQWTKARQYGLLAVGCLAAAGVHPYGYGELARLAVYLRQSWMMKVIEEYQSPHFQENQFVEVLVITSLLTAALLAVRGRIAPALLILGWTHATLQSIRHAYPLVVVAAPYIAAEATRLWENASETVRATWWWKAVTEIGRDHRDGVARISIWTPAAIVLLATVNIGIPWPTDFPSERFPADVVSRHADLLSSSRVFSTDSWSDYLTFHFYPKQRVFIDGRIGDTFGQRICEQYQRALNGQKGWEAVFAEYRVDAALVPSDSAIASLLARDPQWKMLEDSGHAALFKKL